MCDRVGIGAGWQNLPGGLASDNTIEALKAEYEEEDEVDDNDID